MTTLRDDLAEALRLTAHSRKWCKWSDLWHEVAHDDESTLLPSIVDDILATDAGKRLQARLDAARSEIRALVRVLEFHRQTPIGQRKRCLPECLACALLARYDGILAAGEEK